MKGDGARKILLVYSTVNPSTAAKMLVKPDREVGYITRKTDGLSSESALVKHPRYTSRDSRDPAPL
jgi:hypothetical protein